ncbi:MAG TPA: autotransporter-associated beta strand repeat-containing protein, partial [Humisphaera sp.]
TFGPASGTVVFSGGIINLASAATISVGNAGDTINSVLAGGATSLTKAGAGTLTLTAANTYAGSTLVASGTVALSGAAGSISASSGLVLSGGGISITNTSATEAGVDRLGNAAAVTSNGGTLTFSNTSGTTVYAESIGTVGLVAGQLNLVQSVNQAGTGSQTLTLGGLGRTGAGNTSVVTFSAASTGPNATKNVYVVTGATATPAGQIIGPWATTGTTAALQTDYAVYNGSAQVVPANVAGSAESTWTTPGNAYTTSAGGTVTLSATRTVAALRNTGATTVLTLGTGADLETYGLLNGTTSLLSVAPGTGGALTTPAGGGNLYVVTGSGAVTISAPVNDNGGAVTLVKSGSGGTLTLSSTSGTFSGGLVINAGAVAVTANANLGAGGGVTFNGSGSVSWTSGTYARNVTVNNGAVATFDGGNATISGNVTGTGGVAVSNTFGSQYTFSGASNTFEGPVLIGLVSGTTGQAYRTIFASIADSAAASGRIRFLASSVTHADGSVFEYTGGSNLVLDNRQFELASATAGPTNGHQIRSNGTGTVTVRTDLIVSTAAAQTLSLGGSNTGANAFTGNITNGAGTVSVLKTGTGAWALAGTNTYTGNTVNGFTNPAGAGLTFQGVQALPPATTLAQTHNGGTGGFGTIKILDDAASPASRSGVNLSMTSSNTSHTMTLFVGNNGVANGGTSAATTSGSTIVLGNLTFTQAASGNTSQTLAVTGANGYGLRINNVTLPATLAGTASWSGAFAATTAPLTIAGSVTQAAGNASGVSGTLTLDGTATANQVTGNISDASDIATTGRPLKVNKVNAGTWTLSGNNTFSGGLTLSGASAGSQLNINSPTALGTGAFTISGGDNAKLDNTSGAAVTLSTNNAQNWSNNFTFVGTGDLNLGTGTVTLGGARTITISAGTLTVGGVISGTGFGITKAGLSTTLALNGLSTFTGNLTIGQGAIAVSSIRNYGEPSAVGAAASGNIVIANQNSSTLSYTGAGDTTNRTVQIGPTGSAGVTATVNNNGTGALVFNGATFNTPVTITAGTASRTLSLGGSYTGTSEIQGVIANNALGGTATAPANQLSLTKTGAGTWAVSGANTYSGTTTVSAGVLLVSNAFTTTESGTGTGAVSITATLGGTGQITPGGANAVTVNSGGTLAPGSGGIGTLTVNAANTTATSILSFASGAKLLVELGSGLQSDRVAVRSVGANDVVFNSTVVNFSDLTAGSLQSGTYTLFSADAAGAYAGLTTNPDGTIATGLTIGTGLTAYPGSTLAVAGTDIVLNVVPEPGAASLAALACAGLLSRRRRWRR